MSIFQYPIPRLLPFLVGGILSGTYLYSGAEVMFLSLFILLFLLLAEFFQRDVQQVFKQQKMRTGLISVLFFLLGNHLVLFHDVKNNTDYFAKNDLDRITHYEITISESPQIKPRSVQIIGKINTVNKEGRKIGASGNLLVYLFKDERSKQLRYGDKILIKGKPVPIAKTKNPGAFSYADFTAGKQIYHQVYADSLRWINMYVNEGGALKKLALASQEKITSFLRKNGVEERELAVANALLLGDKNLLNPKQREAYSTAGAMHILAVSGLHVGVVLLIFQFLFKPLKKRRWLYIVLLLSGIWSYALLTGLSPSVMRASLMFSLVGIGGVLYRKNNVYHTILTSAFILLLFDPTLIKNIGFQLSYVAVLGIVYLQPRIYQYWQPSNFILDKLWQLIAVSLAAQLATFPLSAYYFHQFPTYFLLTNILVIPFAGIILYLAFAILLFSWQAEVVYLLTQVLQKTLWIMNEIIVYIEKLPFSKIGQLRFDNSDLLLLYTLLISSLIFFFNYKPFWRRLSVFVLFLLFFNRLWFSLSQHQSKEWVVFHTNKHSIQAFVRGHNFVVFTSEVVNEERGETGMLTDAIASAKGLYNPAAVKDHLDTYKTFYGLKILYLNDSNQSAIKELEPDYVILNNNVFLDVRRIENLTKKPLFIADGTCSYGYKKTLKRIVQALNYSFYDVSEEGAYIKKVL